MEANKFVITVDEDTQGLIINSLLLMRDKTLKEGMNTEWISDVILQLCNAPMKKEKTKGDGHER